MKHRLFRRDEVSQAKLTMEFMGRLVVGLRGIYRRLEVAQINILPIDSNGGAVWILPVADMGKHNDPPEPGLAVQARSLIHPVLGARDYSQVVLAAIKTISVYVVNILGWESHNQGMKRNRYPSAAALGNMRLRVIISSYFPLVKIPLKAADHIRVVVVDHCRLALREWNYNHVLIVPNSGGMR